MNTIFIVGSAKCVGKQVEYSVNIWGSPDKEQIQFVRPFHGTISGHVELWRTAKDIVKTYFNIHTFDDGAYTSFLEDLTVIH